MSQIELEQVIETDGRELLRCVIEGACGYLVRARMDITNDNSRRGIAAVVGSLPAFLA